jgi:stage II sporulation protein D
VSPRRVLVATVALLLAPLAGSASARSICTAPCTAAPAGSGPLFVFTGHGWGHGVGLAQWGAYGYAQHGWTYDQIVGHYYPGTTLGPAPISRIRVLLADGKTTLAVRSASDYKVKDGAGTTHTLAAGKYVFGKTFKLPVDGGASVSLTPPLTFDAGASPVELDHPYRGSIVVDLVDGKLRAINVLGLEQYLYGVVPSEMPFTWAPEALKAQAVAARSYALATRQLAAPFDVYSDTRSQVYLGLSHEKPSTNAAVNATAGQVVLYQGQVARTYFYSSSGGRTANASDVWATTTPVPYLISVADPYDVISPYHDWGPVTFTGKALAKAFSTKDVVDARTMRSQSSRVRTLQLLAPMTQVDVPGTMVRTKLKLRSTWFTVGVLSLVRPTPTTLEYGAAAQLTGLARGIAGAMLEQKAAGASWQPLQPAPATTDGTVTMSAKPSVTTQYRLATSTFASAPVRVSVSPRVRFEPLGEAGELRGTVRPVLPGAPVEIQRQDEASGAWRTVASATVDSTGAYRARVTPGKGFVPGLTPPLRVVSG